MKTTLRVPLLSVLLTLGLASASHAAATDNRDVVHDKFGQVVRSTFGTCVRTGWPAAGDECAKAPVVQTRLAKRQPISDEQRTVYFEFNSTRLVDSERSKLESLANTLKPMDDILGVSIVGYADSIGTPSYNERLSKRRAQVVETYLRERGYLKTTVAQTRWLGESAPVTQCPDNLEHTALVACLQKDRRVTVEINYEKSPAY